MNSMQSLEIMAFRCFEDHTVELRQETVIVGKNNAGKTSLVEALKILSLALAKLKTTRAYKKAPGWTGLSTKSSGIHPSLKEVEFEWEEVQNNRSEWPVLIRGIWLSGVRIQVHLGEDQKIFATASIKGKNIKSAAEARREILETISILSQVEPLQRTEEALSKEYVLSNLTSSRASRHFRNQLSYLEASYYNRLKRLAEETWDGLRIIRLDKASRNINNNPPKLTVMDRTHYAEVGFMGHGLQMWLQLLWFVVRSEKTDLIVLDEPDVYLHADLQRRLIRLLRARNQQYIVTTHSTEILSEILPSNMLVLDRSHTNSMYGDELEDIQSVINLDIGSIHNLSLSRLWNSKKLLWVEGKDVAVLKHWHASLHPLSKYPLDSIPHADMEGWAGWKYAIGGRMIHKNAGGAIILNYCLFDRDYYPNSVISERYAEAQNMNIELHIWRRKELENYLIWPTAICRVVVRKRGHKGTEISADTIKEKIEELATDATDSLEERIMDALGLLDKQHVIVVGYDGAQLNKPSRIQRFAKETIKRFEAEVHHRIGGKQLLKDLNSWLSLEYKSSCSAQEIASEMYIEEVPKEVRHVLHCIEENILFSEDVYLKELWVND